MLRNVWSQEFHSKNKASKNCSTRFLGNCHRLLHSWTHLLRQKLRWRHKLQICSPSPRFYVPLFTCRRCVAVSRYQKQFAVSTSFLKLSTNQSNLSNLFNSILLTQATYYLFQLFLLYCSNLHWPSRYHFLPLFISTTKIIYGNKHLKFEIRRYSKLDLNRHGHFSHRALQTFSKSVLRYYTFTYLD